MFGNQNNVKVKTNQMDVLGEVKTQDDGGNRELSLKGESVGCNESVCRRRSAWHPDGFESRKFVVPEVWHKKTSWIRSWFHLNNGIVLQVSNNQWMQQKDSSNTTGRCVVALCLSRGAFVPVEISFCPRITKATGEENASGHPEHEYLQHSDRTACHHYTFSFLLFRPAFDVRQRNRSASDA